MASAVNLLDVEAIVLGGGLGVRFGQDAADRIAAAMAPHLFNDDAAAGDARGDARGPRRRNRCGAPGRQHAVDGDGAFHAAQHEGDGDRRVAAALVGDVGPAPWHVAHGHT